MGHFDRPERPTTLPEIPERLLRLDRELDHKTGTKDFDYLYAVKGEYRIRVCVMRCLAPSAGSSVRDYIATASFYGKVHRAYGPKPSHAYAFLARQLSWAVSRYEFDKNITPLRRRELKTSQKQEKKHVKYH